MSTATNPTPAHRAWRVRCPRIEGPRGTGGICSATSRSKAIAIALASARDVYGRKCIAFVDFKATRAPEYDAWAAGETQRKHWTEEYVKDAMKL